MIAHEVGHHVQKLLGTSQKVHARASASSQEQANAALGARSSSRPTATPACGRTTRTARASCSRRATSRRALNAAAAIGDDRIQRQTQGAVVPESFTHGSSEQRVSWFRRGFESGRMQDCDTFAGG